MGVISGTKLQFRVNATRITTAENPKNYGSTGDFIHRRTEDALPATRGAPRCAWRIAAKILTGGHC